MFLRLKSLPATGLALAFALAACSDSTGPSFDGNFDATATSTNLSAVESAYGTPAFQSFVAMGQVFDGPGAPLASAALIQAAANPHDLTLNHQAQLAAQRVAGLMAAPQATLIPEEYRGLVFEYVFGEGYVVNQDLTGPVNGIEVKLYAVNPVTGEITEPLTEVGYVHLLDESTDVEAKVRLQVVSNEVTYLDYLVTLAGPPTSPSFAIAGYVTDGTNVVDFSLSFAIEVTFAGFSVELDYLIDVNDVFNIDFSVAFTGSGEDDGTAVIDLSVTHEGYTVSVAGTIDNGSGSVEVRAGEAGTTGDLFATITVTPTSISVVGADGQALSAEEIRALEELWDFFEDIFDSWDDLFSPVEFLFGGP
jgi:hypothetical protein